jgi:hypothetical protein
MSHQKFGGGKSRLLLGWPRRRPRRSPDREASRHSVAVAAVRAFAERWDSAARACGWSDVSLYGSPDYIAERCARRAVMGRTTISRRTATRAAEGSAPRAQNADEHRDQSRLSRFIDKSRPTGIRTEMGWARQARRVVADRALRLGPRLHRALASSAWAPRSWCACAATAWSRSTARRLHLVARTAARLRIFRCDDDPAAVPAWSLSPLQPHVGSSPIPGPIQD